MHKYKSNLNIFFKGGYLENNIVPLITDIPDEMTIADVDAWEVMFEDLDKKIGFFKSFDPQTDFYMFLEQDKSGIIFFGKDWKRDCINYFKQNNLQNMISNLGLVHD
jgi:hypothetical protein